MRKPTFLGIGVPRSGTTWVYELLEKHEKVYVARGKEIHFFDHKYHKGYDCYERLFEKEGYDHYGEFTPHYMFRPNVEKKVKKYAWIDKFIIVLRNPVDRMISHYRLRIQKDGYNGSFKSFIGDYPESIVWSLYTKPLRKWFNTFGRNKFLILIHEEMFEDVENTRGKIARFLGLNPNRFADQAGEQRVNESVTPKVRALYGALKQGAKWMRRSGVGGTVDFLNRMGITHRLFANVFGTVSSHQICSPDQRRNLGRHFVQEVSCLEDLLGRSLPWEFET